MFNVVIAHTQQVTEDMWERRFKSFNINIPELTKVFSGYKKDSHPHVVDVNPVKSEDGCTQPTASNTGSLQFPSLKEVREAYEKHMQQYTFSKEKNYIGVIEFVREYIITTCKQQAGA